MSLFREVNRTLESNQNLAVIAAIRKRYLLAFICIVVLFTILTLGLWPFHAPRNGVTWLGNREGLRFGAYSGVISSRPFRAANSQSKSEASLEIWLQPRRIWDSGTLLAFYSPANLCQFSMRQVQTDLILRTSAEDERHHLGTRTLRIENVFKPRPAFITITAGGQGAAIYIDGALIAATPQFSLSARDFNGLLVLGDSPGQPDSWEGQLFGFAIVGRQLEAKRVFDNYATWKQTGRPELSADERYIALYLFDEHDGRVVRDKAQSGVDLYIPQRYQVADKIMLEPFWAEFSMTRSYWGAALKNIVGFIPFGICFSAYLSAALSKKRALLLTVALGALTSLTIEVLQGFLPTRDSGTTDVITNTLGTWIGIVFYRWLTPALVQFVPWLPLTGPAQVRIVRRGPPA